MRINKYIAKSGLCSRRMADKYIEEGRVKVNGEILQEMGYIVKKEDVVSFDGKVLNLVDEKIYIMLNKPIGYVCTNKDRFAEKTIFDLIDEDTRLFSIGRLDADSRGLILISNDGDLYNSLMHPKSQIFKTYEVKLNKEFNCEDAKVLERGVDIGGYITAPAVIRILTDPYKVKISISEGKNRQVRKMLKVLNYDVLDLNRVSIAELELGKLKLGEYRNLTEDEINYLSNI